MGDGRSRAADPLQTGTNEAAAPNGGLEEFKSLYDPSVAELIRWSEGDVLKPVFLHLHEDDIGEQSEQGEQSEYRLWKNLRAFVMSLSGVRPLIERIVFCYSHEDPVEKSYAPEDCAHKHFYYCELKSPTKEDLGPSDFVYPGGNIERRMPEPPLIEKLPDVLEKCDLIQPYMLRVQAENRLASRHELVENSAELRRSLVREHRLAGAYQFSIIGYELKPRNGGEKAKLTDAQKLFLNMAYLIHAWTWNHDLRAAQRIRTLKLAASDNDGNSVIPLAKEFWNGAAHPSLFHEPHAIEGWRANRFPVFLNRIYNELQSAERLITFVGLCGWPSANIPVPENAAAIDHARGAWLAVKLLTNRALERKLTSVSFDQLVLAILFATDRARRDGNDLESTLPVRIIRKVECGPPHCMSQDDRLRKLLLFPDSQLGWLAPSYRIDTDGDKMTLTWVSAEQGSTRLAGYVASGMMAIRTPKADPQILELPKGVFPTRLLQSISQLTSVMVEQRARPTEEWWVKLTGIVAEENTASDGSVRARICFEFDGRFPIEAVRPAGETDKQLTELEGYFNVRVRSLEHEHDTPGLFMVDGERHYFVINMRGKTEESLMDLRGKYTGRRNR